MFCPKCGDKVEQNEIYCNKCGNYLGNVKQQTLCANIGFSTNSTNLSNVSNNQLNNYCPVTVTYKNSDNKKIIFLGVGIGLLLLFFFSIFVIDNFKNNYYFSNNNYENNEDVVQSPNNSNTGQKKGKYSTVIIADNTYSGVNILDEDDAYELIVKDSVSQKDNCPSEIKKVENEIINKYGVTAVNLCEMDINFAKEIVNVFKQIYEEYPGVRENLTNLSLKNASFSEGYIAAFYPIFSFATSNSSSTYPWVFKTQILLNTKYFLNADKLETSVKDSSNSGHFPPNTTIYSPVAHELGHYLSFLAVMRHYDVKSILLIDNSNVDKLYKLYDDYGKGDFSLLMITEAYQNYKKEIGTNLNIDEWRAQISNYAVAKDNNGNYIYDETIAEAFHDVYLNGDNSNDVSRYVVNVLKKKLEG